VRRVAKLSRQHIAPAAFEAKTHFDVCQHDGSMSIEPA
jgi:hypothetical protein